MLNLPLIDKGVDSFQLRIWVKSMMNPKYLTLIKFEKAEWSTYEYRYYVNGKEIDSMVVYKVPTSTGIDSVVAYLKRKEILELPSQMAIPNFVDSISDGQTCIIEIATSNFYKALEYHCPEHYSYEPHNLKFMGIIKFLNPYFNFYSPWCKPGE